MAVGHCSGEEAATDHQTDSLLFQQAHTLRESVTRPIAVAELTAFSATPRIQHTIWRQCSAMLTTTRDSADVGRQALLNFRGCTLISIIRKP